MENDEYKADIAELISNAKIIKVIPRGTLPFEVPKKCYIEHSEEGYNLVKLYAADPTSGYGDQPQERISMIFWGH